MFYQGPLQQAILTALTQRKPVLVFIADESDESSQWEHEWLPDESLRGLISDRSVALRLKAGSEEAGYFAELCPIRTTPLVVIIKSGEVKAYIQTPCSSKDEFVAMVKRMVEVNSEDSVTAVTAQDESALSTASLQDESAAAFSSEPEAPASAMVSESAAPGTLSPSVLAAGAPAPSNYSVPAMNSEPAELAATSPAPAPSNEPAELGTSSPHMPGTNEAAASTSTSAPAANVDAQRSDSAMQVLRERAARLQSKMKEAERKAKEDRAKAKEKAKSEAEAGIDTDAARTHKQAEEIKKRRQKEQEERLRILKRIEDDKAERRLRAAEREKQRLDNQKGGDVAAALVNAPETKLPSTTRASDMTALQVRLFDGSTLRSRFKTAVPLNEVRQWVDENRTDGEAPFGFKQVLTPLPNKNIDQTEESQSLGDLGLAPSSTLVLIPVHKFVAAYEPASRNILSRIFALIWGLFSWFLGFLGLGGRRRAREEGAPSEEDSQGSTASSQARERRIRGFDSRQDQRDQQLYNGNSLNFEPRPDEDEK